MTKKKQTASLNPRIDEIYMQFRKPVPTIEELWKGIRVGDPHALSRAITLLESKLPAHRKTAGELVERALPYAGKSYRIGITGVPGAGKSTFIDRLGQWYIAQGKKTAVLAVDPSGVKGKGSILGDKTRMDNLVSNEKAFIRPSPTDNVPGGVGRKTRESIILCEAAGFDRILVETVGVGQSEVQVHSMTDFFLLLKIPGAGDELQGIKRGIIELADMILINKADGDRIREADIAAKTFRNALRYFSDMQRVPVRTVSALENKGIAETAVLLEKTLEERKKSGFLDKKRQKQDLAWFEESLQNQMQFLFEQSYSLKSLRKSLEQQIIEKKLSPFKAAEILWKEVFPEKS